MPHIPIGTSDIAYREYATTTERTGALVIWFTQGRRMTVDQMAKALGISKQSVHEKLDLLSVLPDFPLTSVGGIWYLAGEPEQK